MHLDNGLLQNVKKNIIIYVQTSAQVVGLQHGSTSTTRNINFHILIDQGIFTGNHLVKTHSCLFAFLTLCGVIIIKTDQLMMGWGKKKIPSKQYWKMLSKVSGGKMTRFHYATLWPLSYNGLPVYKEKVYSWGKTKQNWWHLAHGFAWKVKAKSTAKILNNTHYVRTRKQKHASIKGLASLQSSSQLGVRLFLGI